jgi:predicted DNA-binding protein
MNSKDSTESTEPATWVTLTVRVTPDTAQAIKAVADRCYRPVATEVRRLIEERIAEAAEEQRKAA